jgi:uncharacterized protein (DUF1697 family)
MRYIALLRGINVGGHAKLPMADLRTLLGSLGYTDVSTYIQSGNAFFTSPNADPSALEEAIQESIARDLGLTVPVVIRTRDEMATVIARNPFPAVADSPTSLHVSFLSAQPDPARVAAIDPQQYLPDEFRMGDRVVYLWLPNGFQRTKLGNDRWERQLGVRATTRNWNTVNKLLSLADG